MIMIDTQLGCELARMHQQYKTARYCDATAPCTSVRDLWRRKKRQRRAAFIKLAEKLADQLIEERFNDMEIGP